MLQISLCDITKLYVDVLVNAANKHLQHGGGVCHYIFNAAGHDELQKACDEIGYCETGSAVITPGFNSNAKYIIHAVGPIYDGNPETDKLLYNAYISSLNLAKAQNAKTIAFPLISAGIFGYPGDIAWTQALTAYRDFMTENSDYDLTVIFAIIDMNLLNTGLMLKEQLKIE